MEEHHVVQWLGMPVNIDTLQMTWIAMAIVFVLAILATKSLSLVPGRWQSVFELAIEYFSGQVDEVVGSRGKFLKPVFISLFLFILTCNWFDQIPIFHAPTSDLNTTLGLALLVIVSVHVLALYFRGGKYVAHFFEPFKVFVVINLIEELAKPVTLSFRLFGNIFAGAVLTWVLSVLLPSWFFPPGLAWQLFGVFVGFIQAFVFTMLSISYFGNALKDGH
ncbi:MAG: F0F1 ATP synthase subunit A [Negativicutes bacterium]|nr:F0F1 ATP synthase subunit A [Negativicutes bacterium]